MKEWNTPSVEEVEISNTQYGGTPNNDFDNSYYDQNGALHVNFTPEPDPVPDQNS